MNYEEKYNAALERMKSWVRGEHPECFSEAQKAAEFIFPELKESEEERIRKKVIEVLKLNIKGAESQMQASRGVDRCFEIYACNKVIAWLEKQGEQKPVDKVEPKFNLYDWVVTDKGDTVQIGAVNNGYYTLCNGMDFNMSYVDKCWHKWTIEDAKDGDVLAVDNRPFIYNGSKDEITVGAYCGFNEKHIFSFAYDYVINRSITPATKEQRDLLFKSIADYGYDWDAENKKFKKIELKKIEPKFHPGDWIIDNEYGEVLKVTKADANSYEITRQDGEVFDILKEDVECNHRLWTIENAKDGDVLVCNINKAEIGGDIEKLPNITPTICIYQNVVKDKDFIHSYCSLYNGSSLVLQNRMYYNTFVYNIQPATKEQCELLFQKIAEAGCKWDAEKKEAKKIEVVSNESEDEQIKRELRNDLLLYVPTPERYISWIEKQGHMLDTDKVIEWLKTNVFDDSAYGKAMNDKFKKDFEL